MEKLEARIQSESYIWFNNTFKELRGLLYHVPNGEKRDIITAAKLKAMGVVAGVPDMQFHFKTNTYFFEFKKPNSGKASEEQKKIHKSLEAQGFCVWLIESKDEFKEIILDIVNNPTVEVTKALSRSDFEYRYKVFQYLYSMDDGDIKIFEKICSKETKYKFIKFVSEFIEEGYDEVEGFEILITPDYKAVYKKMKGSDVQIDYEL